MKTLQHLGGIPQGHAEYTGVCRISHMITLCMLRYLQEAEVPIREQGSTCLKGLHATHREYLRISMPVEHLGSGVGV